MKTYIMVTPLGQIRAVVRSSTPIESEQGAEAVQVDYDVDIAPEDGSTPFYDATTGEVRYLFNLTAARDARWEIIKRERDLHEFGGFIYDGNKYDSDAVSQARIMAASLSNYPQVWTTQDNKHVELSTDDMLELYRALQQHVMSVHERGRIARSEIYAATSKEDIDAITL